MPLTLETYDIPDSQLGISPLGMVLVALSAVIGLAIFLDPTSATYDIAIGSTIVLSIALAFGAGLQRWKNEADLKLTLLLGVAGAALVSVIITVVGLLTFTGSTTVSQNFLLVLALPAIFEELLFRGGLFLIIRRVTNWYIATFAQAFAFAIYHSWVGLDLQYFMLLFVGGIILQLIFLASKNILSSMISHAIINLKPYMLQLLMQPLSLVIIAIAVTIYILKKRSI